MRKLFTGPTAVLAAILLISCLSSNIYAEETNAPAPPALAAPSAPQGAATGPPTGPRMEDVTPAKREEAGKEVSKTGGQLTPEALEALRNNPQFKGVNPEEIVKGKELLKNKEALKKEEKQHGEEEGGGPAPGGRHDAGEKGSLFDRYISDTPPMDVSTRLKPFGYDLFMGAALNPPQDLPVASDYIIGPGDEVNVLVWGRVNVQHSLIVSRDGTILFPGMGPLTVAGMTYEKIKKNIEREVRNTIGTEVNVTMGRLRSIQVFVLGEVKKPGAYTVSSMSTITNALMAAGGVSDIGTLRNVELKRGGKKAAAMDFYDLLLKGDKSNDVRLQNGDVVFVPTVGPLVGVAGNVKRPGIYELNGAAGLSVILDLAGGIIPTAYTQQIQVERVEKNEKRVVVDINGRESGKANGFMLQDADLVKIFSIVGSDVNAVYLYGNVKRPGKYELKKGMRLGDAIMGESNLSDETYFEYGLIKRLVPPSYEVRLIPFNLGNLLFRNSAEDNIELKSNDSIYIFSKWFFSDRPYVTIEGEARKNGKFDLSGNMTVKDLILMASGLTDNASYNEFELYRTDPRTKEVRLSKFNLEKALEGGPADNVTLKNQDRVVIHSIREDRPRRSVTVTGEVNRPGTYEYAENMTVRDLVFAAGGLRESAFVDEAELAQSVIKAGQSFAITYEKIDLRKALSGEPLESRAVHPYDTLFIKKIPEWREENYVEVKGEVVFPGMYIIRKGEKLSSLIERAGGLTAKAYSNGAAFTRESVRKLQQKNIDESVNRLEKTLLGAASTHMQSSLTPEDAKQQAAAFEQKKELIAKMREARAKGRISINLEEAMKKKGSSFDVELENGDKLAVPQRPAEVQVMGLVYNQTAFVYDPAATVSSYIKKAGGFTEDANEDAIYILKEDGTALSRYDVSRGPRWDSANHSWVSGGLMDSRLDPGDTIVVPEKVEKIAWLREIKDFTQILYQIAVTAGVAIRLL